MSSIGPSLPDHLQKRKRSDNEPGSPPSKTQRVASNQDEIDLSDSGSEDDYGPKPVAGLAMPPTAYTNKDGIDVGDSDADTGPAPPPKAAPQPQPQPTLKEDDDDSSSDDGYGPSLPSASTSRPQIGPSMPPQPSDQDDTPRRDDWMLAPPTSGAFTERDPTKLKARKFTSGKPGSSSSKQSGPSSIWTETPEEKLQRLQDAVLGRSAGPGEKPADGEELKRKKETEERNRVIAQNIQASRGKTLMEEHGNRRKEMGQDKEEEDDPSKRGFDREKDMALGGSLGSAQRRELLNKSANFGGRFSKGSYL